MAQGNPLRWYKINKEKQEIYALIELDGVKSDVLIRADGFEVGFEGSKINVVIHKKPSESIENFHKKTTIENLISLYNMYFGGILSAPATV